MKRLFRLHACGWEWFWLPSVPCVGQYPEGPSRILAPESAKAEGGAEFVGSELRGLQTGNRRRAGEFLRTETLRYLAVVGDGRD
jgi:hypothetical protein